MATIARSAFELPKLPYDEGALAPVISPRTVSCHYWKHHAGYLANLNKLTESDFEGFTIEEIIVRTAFDSRRVGLFNNAAQAWNHEFYWESMKPNGGGEPRGELKIAIENSFGGVKEFRELFSKAALGQFGSGWAWLILDANNALKIVTTGNSDTPIAHQQTPLLTLDVWEHAYYLDFQNRRADYIDGWFKQLVNWTFAEDQFHLR